MNFFYKIINEVAGGLLAIVCAIIGAKIAGSAERKRDKINALNDAFSVVAACYYFCLSDNTAVNLRELAIAAERMSLLCSGRTERMLNELLFEMMSRSPDFKRSGHIMKILKKLVKDDVGNG